MEIPRLVPLARDDRSGKAPRPLLPWNPGDPPYCHPDGACFAGDWRDLQPGIPATSEGKTLPCSQKIIRRQLDGKTEQLAVGASRPADGMRKHLRLPAAPGGVLGPGPRVGKGFSKGETTTGFTL